MMVRDETNGYAMGKERVTSLAVGGSLLLS